MSIVDPELIKRAYQAAGEHAVPLHELGPAPYAMLGAGSVIGGGLMGGMAGVPFGGVAGAARGHFAEGVGRGVVRGSMTGAGGAAGGLLGATLGGMAGHPAIGNAVGSLLGAGGGWIGSGAMLGPPSGRDRERPHGVSGGDDDEEEGTKDKAASFAARMGALAANRERK